MEEEKIMAKKNDEKKINIILGIALIVVALIGIGNIITLLMIALGIYFIYQGLKG